MTAHSTSQQADQARATPAGVIPIPQAVQDRIRVIRLWHWRQAMRMREIAARERAKDNPAAIRTARTADALANDHIRFVQTLNDFFAPGDNAEKDNAR